MDQSEPKHALDALIKGESMIGQSLKQISLLGFEPTTQEQQSNVLDVSQLLATIRRRRLTILGTTFVVVMATLSGYFIRPKIYEGQFQILIEPVTAESEVVSAISGNNPSIEDQGLGVTQAGELVDYPTQIKVLLSPKLLTEVVSTLSKQYPELTYEDLSHKIQILRVQDADNNDTKVLEVRYSDSSKIQVSQIVNQLSKNYLDYSLHERQTNLRRAMQFVAQQLPQVELRVKQIEQSIQSFRERFSFIDPETSSKEAARRLSDIQQQRLSNQIELVQSRELFRSLQDQFQDNPSVAEAASVLSDAPEYQKILNELQSLETQIATESSVLTPNHPTIIDLREKRAELLPILGARANLTLGQRTSRNISGIKELPYQNSLRQDFSKEFIETSMQIKVLEARSQSLQIAEQVLSQQIQELPAITREYESLQRQLKIATTNLSKFLEKREELNINIARKEVPWELLAQPSISAEHSQLPNILILSSVFGLFLGLGLSLITDQIRDIIFQPQELRNLSKYPLIGSIPIKEESSTNVLSDLPEANGLSLIDIDKKIERPFRYYFSPFLEAFRALAFQIRLLKANKATQSFVITSALREEGKTTTAINLAKASAAMGYRVLLVDVDLRAPSIAGLLELNYEPGLSDILERESDPQAVIQNVPQHQNLFVLTAGMSPADPMGLLGSKKVQDLTEIFHNEYDLVIYDAPPMEVADATLLSTLTDGLILVSRLGMIDRKVFKECLQSLETSKVNVLGIVANYIQEKHRS